jgi:hypothetical protein
MSIVDYRNLCDMQKKGITMKATEEERSSPSGKSYQPVAAIAGRTTLLLAFLMPAILAASGCARPYPSKPSEDVRYWTDPDIVFDAPVATVHQAALDALRKLSCTVDADKPYPNYLNAHFENNMAVEIFLKEKEGNKGKTEVLVKTFRPFLVAGSRTDDVIDALKEAMNHQHH